MEIKRLLYGKYSIYVISALLGFGLATLFRKVCKERNCLVFKAPSINKIEGKTYKVDNTCYKVKHKQVQYSKTKTDVHFE
jgi:hypothetical protein